MITQRKKVSCRLNVDSCGRSKAGVKVDEVSDDVCGGRKSKPPQADKTPKTIARPQKRPLLPSTDHNQMDDDYNESDEEYLSGKSPFTKILNQTGVTVRRVRKQINYAKLNAGDYSDESPTTAPSAKRIKRKPSATAAAVQKKSNEEVKHVNQPPKIDAHGTSVNAEMTRNLSHIAKICASELFILPPSVSSETSTSKEAGSGRLGPQPAVQKKQTPAAAVASTSKQANKGRKRSMIFPGFEAKSPSPPPARRKIAAVPAKKDIKKDVPAPSVKDSPDVFPLDVDLKECGLKLAWFSDETHTTYVQLRNEKKPEMIVQEFRELKGRNFWSVWGDVTPKTPPPKVPRPGRPNFRD